MRGLLEERQEGKGKMRGLLEERQEEGKER